MTLGKCPTCDHIRELCICNLEQPNVVLCPMCHQDLELCECITPLEANGTSGSIDPDIETFLPDPKDAHLEELQKMNQKLDELIFAIECLIGAVSKLER